MFTAEQFDVFQAGLRSGKTDGLCLEMTHHAGMWTFRSAVPQPVGDEVAELTFTDAEVAAFVDGMNHNEFDVPDTTVAARAPSPATFRLHQHGHHDPAPGHLAGPAASR